MEKKDRAGMEKQEQREGVKVCPFCEKELELVIKGSSYANKYYWYCKSPDCSYRLEITKPHKSPDSCPNCTGKLFKKYCEEIHYICANMHCTGYTYIERLKEESMK